MLVLSRKSQEAVVVSGATGFEQVLKVTVLGFCNGRVRLGFEAGADVPIHRAEVWERIRAENGASNPEPTAHRAINEATYLD
jgi:carbon storage regulator CsrA